MWTYFVILLSVSALLLVFLRRVFLYFKKDEIVEEKVEKEAVSEKDDVSVSKKDKQSAEAYFQKGEDLIKAGKDEDAIKCFVQALTLSPGHFSTSEKLAFLYMQKEMFSAAAVLFKEMGEGTDDAVHFSHLGLALYKQSDLEGARDAYQKAVELDDKRPARFVSLAQVYRGLSQMDMAVIALGKAIEREEENIDYLLLMAEIKKEMGDAEGARDVLVKILELEEKNEAAKMLLKELEREIKENEA